MNNPSAPTQHAPADNVVIAMASAAGPCAENQDAVGARLPTGTRRVRKGMAFAVADGVSTAEAGRVAAETCVQNFLGDYFSTPDAWTVRRSGATVLNALNRWLFGQGLRFRDTQRGCVTTFTGCVLRGRQLHVFHVGDTRLCRLRHGRLDALTRDHRVMLGNGNPVLGRAMGLDHHVDIDYAMHEVEAGDTFVLLTDGIHDRLDHTTIADVLRANADPQAACHALLRAAERATAIDNMSVVIVHLAALPPLHDEDWRDQEHLPLLPVLAPGQRIDGLVVEHLLAESPRSQVYRVRDETAGALRVMKTPSPRCEDVLAVRREYATENWVLRRVQHPRLPRGAEPPQSRSAPYVLMEPLEGESLRAWMRRHRQPPVADALQLARQIAQALRALHRREILHRDVRPENVLVDGNGQVTLIDLGQCRVAALAEAGAGESSPGALEYAAPECTSAPTRAGERSDQFSLAALLYELLAGTPPYGRDYVAAHRRGHFGRLRLLPPSSFNPMVPAWVDAVLARALALDPGKRFGDIAEFADALTRPVPPPDSRSTPTRQPSWLDSDPERFWRTIAVVLALSQAMTLVYLMT